MDEQEGTSLINEIWKAIAEAQELDSYDSDKDIIILGLATLGEEVATLLAKEERRKRLKKRRKRWEERRSLRLARQRVRIDKPKSIIKKETKNNHAEESV